MRKRIIHLVFVTSLTVLTACNTQSEPKDEAMRETLLKESVTLPTVSVTTVNLLSSYRIPKEFVGTIQASQRANLGFELSGKINTLFVDVGDSIKKNAPLAQLDTQLLDTELRQLSAQREQLDAQLALMKSNLHRQRQLKKKRL